MERIGVLPGTEVGGYRVLGPLGQGGMGAVYRAVDGDGVAVALKLLHPHLGADPAARARLSREVEHLQRLRHPAVARVLDAEIDADDAFVVTELVQGQDLAARVRTSGPLPLPEVLALGERLHEALVAVHGAGVLHRDLTPANVMMSPRGPVLIDFGIAQGTDDGRLTSAGLVMGTPGYLSPEMLQGADPTRDADLWGWAAVLAFAATGRPPFGTRPVEAVVARVRGGEADLAGLDPRTTAALRSALRVDPARRAAPEDVLDELRRAVDGDTEPDVRPRASADGARTALLPVGATRVLPTGPGEEATAVHATVPSGADDRDTTDAYDGTYAYDETYAYGDEGTGAHDDADAYDGAYDEAHDGDAYDDEADGEAYDDAQDGYLPRRRTGSVLAVGAALVALSAFRPTLALLVGVAVAALARTVGVAGDAIDARRARRGVRPGDAARTAVATPWYAVRGALGVVPAAVVAASTVVVVGGVTWWLVGSGRVVVASPPAGGSAGELAGNAPWVAPALLAAGGALALTTLWLGPLMRTTHGGARRVLGRLAPGWTGAAVVVALSLAVAALVVATHVGEPTVWWPLPGPPELR